MPEIELETIRSTRLDIPVDENGVPILAAVAAGQAVGWIRSTRLYVPVIEDENGNKIPVVSVVGGGSGEGTSDYLETGVMVTTSGGVATINLANPAPVYYVIGGVESVVFSNIPSFGTNTYKQLTFELWLSPSVAITFPAGIDWIGGSAPTLATSKNNCLVFRYNNTVSGSYWVGNLAYSQAQN